jgi:hypothetical protein
VAAGGGLGFMPRAIGRWCDEREEIDVVAVGERDLLLGACKWTGDPVGLDVLEELARKAPRVLRLAVPRAVGYALFPAPDSRPRCGSRQSVRGCCWWAWGSPPWPPPPQPRDQEDDPDPLGPGGWPKHCAGCGPRACASTPSLAAFKTGMCHLSGNHAEPGPCLRPPPEIRVAL